MSVAGETDTSASLLLKVEEFPLCEGIEWSGLKKIKQKDLEEKLPLKRGLIVSDNAVCQVVIESTTDPQHVKITGPTTTSTAPTPSGCVSASWRRRVRGRCRHQLQRVRCKPK